MRHFPAKLHLVVETWVSLSVVVTGSNADISAVWLHLAIPFPFRAGIDIATFGILREHIGAAHGPAPPAVLLMGAGMLSSTTAQLVAYPLGLVRTRLQVRRLRA